MNEKKQPAPIGTVWHEIWGEGRKGGMYWRPEGIYHYTDFKRGFRLYFLTIKKGTLDITGRQYWDARKKPESKGHTP
jgi:hypothetical protein